MLRLLAAVVVAQPFNLNVQAPTRFYCDGGVECHRNGATLVVLGTGSGSAPTGKVAEAYMADAAVFAAQATQLATDPTACTAGQFVTDVAANGTLTCATPSGGPGGGGNFQFWAVTFDGGRDTRANVDAGWATASSVIACVPADESGSVEGIGVTVITRNTGWFVVRAEPRNGRTRGTFSIACTGQ